MNGRHPDGLLPPFPIGAVHIYLVKGDALTLVDVGPKTDEAWAALKQQLKEAGFLPSGIDQGLIHHHVDHAGLLDYLVQESSFTVLGGDGMIQDPLFREQNIRFFHTVCTAPLV